jgi:hypothetical protein
MSDDDIRNLPLHAPKRTEAQKEADYVLIAHHTARGKTFKQIAVIIAEQRNYTLSPAQICYDLKKIREDYRFETNLSLDELVRRELDGLQQQEDELWAAWERSKRSTTKEVTEEGTSTGGETGSGSWSKKSRTIEENIGAPQFQSLLLAIRDRRMELHGLAAPKRTINVNIDATQNPNQLTIKSVSSEQLLEIATKNGSCALKFDGKELKAEPIIEINGANSPTAGDSGTGAP